MEKVHLQYCYVGDDVEFLRFGCTKAEGDAGEKITFEIRGEYYDKEHAAGVTVLGNYPWLNRVFEAMGMKYAGRLVPEKYRLWEKA